MYMPMISIVLHFSETMTASGQGQGRDVYRELIYTMDIKYIDPFTLEKI